MNFQQLYYFVILCESGNVTKAAEKLYITQQALSASIAKLENELSCKLFDRTPKGVALTEGGKYFLDWSTDILLRFQSCHAYFNSLNQPPQTI